MYFNINGLRFKHHPCYYAVFGNIKLYHFNELTKKSLSHIKITMATQNRNLSSTDEANVHLNAWAHVKDQIQHH